MKLIMIKIVPLVIIYIFGLTACQLVSVNTDKKVKTVKGSLDYDYTSTLKRTGDRPINEFYRKPESEYCIGGSSIIKKQTTGSWGAVFFENNPSNKNINKEQP